MQLAHVKKLIELWEANQNNFQDRLKVDPVGTVKAAGIALEPGDEDALKKPNWKGAPDQLMLIIQVRP